MNACALSGGTCIAEAGLLLEYCCAQFGWGRKLRAGVEERG